MGINTKREMYTLLERGVFGNRNKTFSTIEEAERHNGTLGLRYAGSLAGGRFDSHVMPSDVRLRVAEWVSAGYDASRIKISAMMPEQRILMRGQIWRSERYLELDYATTGIDWRKSMAACKHAHGLAAILLLRRTLDASSYDDIEDLINMYDDAVIEFSAYSEDVGEQARRNTVIWEVRNY